MNQTARALSLWRWARNLTLMSAALAAFAPSLAQPGSEGRGARERDARKQQQERSSDRDRDRDRERDRYGDRDRERNRSPSRAQDERRGGPPSHASSAYHYGQRRADDRRGAGPDHAYYRGGRLPPAYRGTRYVVDDWRGHRLSAPPRGYHWVQSGGDYLLVAIATGVILQLLLSD